MLIFDMDGTLINSNGVWREVDIAFLKKRGFPYTKEYYQGVAHTIFPKAAVFTKAYCNLQESTEEIMAEWMEMAGDAYATRVPAKPGRPGVSGPVSPQGGTDDRPHLRCARPLPQRPDAPGPNGVFRDHFLCPRPEPG